MPRVSVVVVGDIGRSPRMCYHALSLASHDIDVDFIGYLSTRPHSIIADNRRIRLIGISPPPDTLVDRTWLPQPIVYLIKFLWTFVVLSITLMFRTGLPSLILVQNPPGLPALAVCYMIARLKRAQFTIDWHNYTWTVLKDTLKVRWPPTQHRTKSSKQWFIYVARKWESYFGVRADWNLCVTHAMRSDLINNWSIRAVTLYDRPPSWTFSQLTIEEKHNVYRRLADHVDLAKLFATNGPETTKDTREVTRFSFRDMNDRVHLREMRPLILISCTSWTIDEDFGILLDALVKYDAIASNDHNSNPESQLPHIVAVITGKGPQKSYYVNKFSKLRLNFVEIVTPWLEAEDYPKLLAAADIGVCLHTSTSGLDLPMKVVDMFGCGVPVLAKRFNCIDELVRDGENGFLFDHASDLSDRFVSLFAGFPLHSNTLNLLCQDFVKQPLVSWEDNWDATVYPLILHSHNNFFTFWLRLLLIGCILYGILTLIYSYIPSLFN